MSKILQLVDISDLHFGSTKALLQPGFHTIEGQPIGQSEIQQWLWDGFMQMNNWLNNLTGKDPYVLILNGDLTEGNHHATTEIWSPEAGDHTKAAVEALAPMAKRAKKKYVIRGTYCHVKEHELAVAHAIGAEVNPAYKQPFWDRLSLTIKGVPISIRHHFPATSRVHLEATQYSIQIANAQLEALRAGSTVPRVILGAHRHRPGHWSDGKSLCCVTGAWQVPTRHVFKIMPDANPAPRVYHLDWRDKDEGELPAVNWFQPQAVPEPTITL